MATVSTHRTTVPDRIGNAADTKRADYSVAVRITGGPSATPEQWARGVFEHAPAPLRVLLVLGWRLAFRLRLGPRKSRETVLGWFVTHSDTDLATLSAGSALIESQHHFLRDDTGLVWVTTVRTHSPLGRILWRLVAPAHELSMPLLLRHAARAAA